VETTPMSLATMPTLTTSSTSLKTMNNRPQRAPPARGEVTMACYHGLPRCPALIGSHQMAHIGPSVPQRKKRPGLAYRSA
jgi:hypothetical protein